jgi:ABC-type multidrug transport system fused ATPase/permease subunit
MFENGDTHNLLSFIIIIAVISICGSYLLSRIRFKSQESINRIRYYLIRDLTEYNLSMPYEYTLNKEKMDQLSKAHQSLLSVNRGAGGAMLNLFDICGFSLSLLTFIWLFSVMPIYMMLFILLMSFISALINTKLTKITKENWDTNAPYHNILYNLSYEFRNPLSKQDLLLYDYITLFKRYFFNIVNIFTMNFLGFSNRKIKVIAISRIINAIKDFVAIIWLVQLFIKGVLNISQVYLYITSLIVFMITFNDLIDTYMKLLENLSIFSDYKVIDQDFPNKSGKLEIPEPPWTIELHNLCFAYSSSNNYVLKNLNLVIRQGESIALVGENGSGKTTLVYLLCRLYKPTSGTITLNNIDIWDYDEKEYFERIRENVFFNNDKDVNEIYKKSGIDEIINKLEKKDMHSLQRILDDSGIELSGGETQKLFLARALSKSNSNLLILDEPTAYLDAINESELYEKYYRLCYGKISIFISHRLASTKFCDKIIYLHQGEIIEVGSHKELLKNNGKYKELFDIQARTYREVAQ